MSDGNGHRWSKFFWTDWESDDKLRLCSFAAQGVWMRALCLMHKSNGFLIVDGLAPNWRDLARIWGGKADQIERYFGELLARGVASRDENGVIYCKRMVNDIKASEAGREHISKRWANRDPNSPPNRDPNRDPNREPISPESRSRESEAERAPLNPPIADATGGLRSRRSSHTTQDSKIPWRSGALQLVYEEGMAELAGEPTPVVEIDPEQQRAAGRALSEAWNSFRPLPKAAQ